MSEDIEVVCDCGAFHATLHDIDPSAGSRAVCYCKDCQAFPRFLGRPELLTPEGGTEIFQTLPGRLSLDLGSANLACVRMSEKGPLRWYTSCCKTPIGNTMASPGVPFLGLSLHTFRATSGQSSIDALTGPSRGGVFTESATSPPPNAEKGKGFPLGMMVQFAKLILKGLISPKMKRSVFFTDPGKQPLAEPQSLTDDQRVAAYTQ